MGFDHRDTAKRYSPQPGDTLRAVAARETAAGHPITWQELALFNWGTDDEEEVDAFLRDDLGALERDADNHFVLPPDDEARDHLLIPVGFQRRGLALETAYTLRVRRKTAPPQFMECCHIPGVTFAFNSAFIRPGVAGYLKKLEAVAGRHPSARVMVYGHTDAVGSDLYNKKLSERRAWSAYAFVVNDPDAWETLYHHPDEDWGLPVLQEILADLGHDPGPPDGDWGPSTRAALHVFLGLPDGAPVKNDEATRKQLFAAYMASKHDVDLPAARFMEPGYMGCGEFNPLAAGDEPQEQNRRVTFFFFHPDRLPVLPCAFADVAPCQKQIEAEGPRFSASFRCSFFDSLARACSSDHPVQLLPQVYLLDVRGEAIPRARWRVRVGGAIVGEGTADGAGLATFPTEDLPDVVELEWGPPADAAASLDAFPFARDYFVRVPKGGEVACHRMLSNLGFDRSDEIARNVEAFQEEIRLRLTGLHHDIAEVLGQWHGTGTRPTDEGSVDEDPEEEDDGVPAAPEVEDEDESGGEPLHPEDVLDYDHDD